MYDSLSYNTTNIFASRDLAEEKGHHECVAFLDNPELELQQWRKKHLVQEASVSPLTLLHIMSIFFIEKCNARMDTVQTTRGSAGSQEEENIERVVHKEKSKYLH